MTQPPLYQPQQNVTQETPSEKERQERETDRQIEDPGVRVRGEEGGGERCWDDKRQGWYSPWRVGSMVLGMMGCPGGC